MLPKGCYKKILHVTLTTMNVIVQKKMKKGPFNLRQLSQKVKADGPGVSGGLVG